MVKTPSKKKAAASFTQKLAAVGAEGEQARLSALPEGGPPLPEPSERGYCRGAPSPADPGRTARIYYELHTNAPPGAEPGLARRDVRLVRLRGLACPLEGWQTQLRFFTGQSGGRGFEMQEGLRDRVVCCVIDNRGVGRSSAPEDRRAYSMEVMAEDVAGVMDHLGWERAHVMGHSMGSMIATRFAAAHPHRVRSLTLISTSGGGLDFIPPWKGIKMMLWFLLQRQTVQARADFDLMCHFTKKWMRHHVPHDVPDSPALKNVRPEELLTVGAGDFSPVTTRRQSLRSEYIRSSEEGVTAQKPEGLNGQLHAVLRHKVTDRDIRLLKQYDFPISLIHGTKDKIVSLKAGQKLAKRLGNRAQMLQVYGAHFVHRECTAEVNAAIQLQVLSSESREDFDGNLSTILETSREWRGSGSVRDPTGATKREGHALEPEFV